MIDLGPNAAEIDLLLCQLDVITPEVAARIAAEHRRANDPSNVAWDTAITLVHGSGRSEAWEDLSQRISRLTDPGLPRGAAYAAQDAGLALLVGDLVSPAHRAVLMRPWEAGLTRPAALSGENEDPGA